MSGEDRQGGMKTYMGEVRLSGLTDKEEKDILGFLSPPFFRESRLVSTEVRRQALQKGL